MSKQASEYLIWMSFSLLGRSAVVVVEVRSDRDAECFVCHPVVFGHCS